MMLGPRKKYSKWLFYVFLFLGSASAVALYTFPGLRQSSPRLIGALGKVPTLNLKTWMPDLNISRSLDILESDAATNAYQQENLIGTLVKYDSVGAYEPFHAEKWAVSNEGKVYEFSLRDNLVTSSGTTIDAFKYVASLKNSLITLKKLSPIIPVFDKIKGFNDGSLAGISALDEKTLRLEFDAYTDGVIEFLAMAYYGYIDPENYGRDGKWKNPLSIISSGSYSLKSWKSHSDPIWLEVVRGIKDETSTKWAIPQLVSSETVSGLFDLAHKSQNTLMVFSPDEEKSISPEWSVLKQTPTYTVSLILNSYSKTSLFQEKRERQFFRSFLTNGGFNESFSSLKYASISDLFYPHFKDSKDFSSDELDAKAPRTFPRKMKVQDPSTARNAYSRLVLEKVIEFLKGKSIGYELVKSSTAKSYIESRTFFRESADIYVAGVDRGGGIEAWVIDMMFCSDLGVGFPDPSKRLKALVSEMREKKLGDVLASKKLEEIIQDDAAVIPVIHYGSLWLYDSETVDLSGLSPSMNLPRFDRIKVLKD